MEEACTASATISIGPPEPANLECISDKWMMHLQSGPTRLPSEGIS